MADNTSEFETQAHVWNKSEKVRKKCSLKTIHWPQNILNMYNVDCTPERATPHSSPHMQWHRSVQLDHNDNKKGIRREWDKMRIAISANGMSACLYNKAVHSTEAPQKQQLQM